MKYLCIFNIFSFFTFLTFYRFGKFLLLLSVIFMLIYFLKERKINKAYIIAISISSIIVLLFMFAFNIALFNGNKILYILYDFNYVIYIYFGIVIHYCLYFYYKDKIFEKINIYLAKVGLIGIIFWILSIYPNFNFILSELIDKTNFLFSFAGFQLPNFNLNKLISNISSYYIYFLPYSFYLFKNNIVKLPFVIITIVILLSASLTQYFILFFYSFTYLAYILIFSKKIIKLNVAFCIKLLLSLSIIIIFSNSSFFNSFIKTKIDAFENIGQINTVSTRIIQGKILLNEFSESFLFGKGLGYESKKYNEIRENFGVLKKRNRAMYEDQYLGILLKFGLLQAGLLLLVYIFLPLALLTNKKVSFTGKKTFLLGYIGMFLFIGSNGNLFYAPQTMVLWSLLLTNSIYLYNNREVQFVYNNHS